MLRTGWCCCVVLMVLLPACESAVDAGDAGPPDTGIADAGEDAAGMCTEFTPEYCPRMYPMTPVAINTICEVFADMFCRANGNCCQRPDEIYPTFAACVSDQQARCMDPVLGYEHEDAITGGTIDYNSAAMGEQRARLGTMSDACTPVRFGDAIVMSMRGRVENGGACTVSPECVDGHHCLAATCQPDPSVGTACSSHDDCAASGLRCEASACAARLADLASCTGDDECESRLCVDGQCAELSGDLAYCVRASEPGRAFER